MSSELGWVEVDPTDDGVDVVGDARQHSPGAGLLEIEDLLEGPAATSPSPHRPGPPRGRMPRWSAPVAFALAATLGIAHLAGGSMGRTTTQGTFTRGDNFSAPGSSVVAELSALAGAQTPFQDIVRPTAQKGACPLVRQGQWPVTTATEAVRKWLPGFTVKGSSRTIDELANLCGLSLQAKDRRGTIAVVIVTPPNTRVKDQMVLVSTGFVLSTPTTTSFVTTTNSTGWTVQVGAIGQNSRLPASTDLVSLAQDPGLLW